MKLVHTFTSRLSNYTDHSDSIEINLLQNEAVLKAGMVVTQHI